jgi:hypothetical protein
LGVYHGNMPEWAVWVDWLPESPNWEWFALDPGPHPKWRSGTVDNTTHWAMGLLDWVQVSVFDAVSHSCTDARITLPHLTIQTKHILYSIEQSVECTKYKLEDLPQNLLIVHLLFYFGSWFSGGL